MKGLPHCGAAGAACGEKRKEEGAGKAARHAQHCAPLRAEPLPLSQATNLGSLSSKEGDR